MNIGIDMMGGDFAPLEAVKGLKSYLTDSLTSNPSFYCIGRQEELTPLFEKFGLHQNNLHIVHAPQVIGYNEHPARALKEKQHSSIAIGFQLLSNNNIDAFISAGNTGAMLVATMYTIKTIGGVTRPAIATIIPKLNNAMGLLLDVGLNADCKPEQLNEFAVLGTVYAKNILNISAPKTGLLNVGEEEGKGNLLMQAAYKILKQNNNIQFIGNIEGRDIFNDKADVIVCDGFTGNIVLKMAESFYDIAVKRGLHHDEYLARFHYENYGGMPVLGVAKPVIIGHGISNMTAFENMIVFAEKMINAQFLR